MEAALTPDLKRISGQEKLPVLALPDGTRVNREAAISPGPPSTSRPSTSRFKPSE
jgi:hypothetical protein